MTADGHSEDVARVARWLASAGRVLVITGAGISAESGLPTYRGIGGLYDRGGTEEGLAIEEVLSGETFARRPELTWKYLHEIERGARGARPSLAHRRVAELDERCPHVVVLTQNVDGLHRAAGSRRVIDIHGDFGELYCTRCGTRRLVADYAGLGPLPRCARCGGVERPEVVLFGEMLPPGKVSALSRELEQGFDVVLSIGTTSVFPYIAGPVLLAARAGRPTVEINPGTTDVSQAVDVRLAMKAGEALEAIWRAWPAAG